MRADRLISIVLILQKQKKISAAKLAIDLGVSVRTIYRDLVVLSVNGFPIYAEHGPGGGVCIIDDFQGGIKTLTIDEVDAFQIMRIPDPLTSLETGKTMQRALLKMFSSLPNKTISSPNLYIDWNWWGHSKSVPGGKLEQVYTAVCNRLSLKVSFPLWNRMEFEQEIDPYGVVAKAGEWYLVYMNTGRCRMRRISDLRNITLTGKTFHRPDEFDLESTWKRLCLDEETSYFLYPVRIRVSPEIFQVLKQQVWGIPYQITEIVKPPDVSGWSMCTLGFENLLAARSHLLGWGNGVEVISPEALRASMLDFAQQINKVYQK
ncbi:MAG: WYL domain-containing protein [Anaerolineae bacterium]|nr:WYL domain-containing protein [Anaerolineae bacterium]